MGVGGLQHIKRHRSHVTRYMSHVTRHTSHVTRHTSHVTRHVLLADWNHPETASTITVTTPTPTPTSPTPTPNPQPPNALQFGYTPIRGLFTRQWNTSRDHSLPMGAHVIVVDPGLHDVASNTLREFRW